ncbi:MAG: nitroreductase family protein, partial [Betaproteobacteria bacterium]
MEFDVAVRERYSCRRYQARSVPIETIRRILDVTQQTPSWCNTQPWHVVVVSG